MAEPIDLSRARILVSNDDGIDAPGIKVLEEVARKDPKPDVRKHAREALERPAPAGR